MSQVNTLSKEYAQAIQAYQGLLEDNYSLRSALKEARAQITQLHGELDKTLTRQHQTLRQQELEMGQLKQTAQALAAQIEERNLMIARMQYETRLTARF